MNLFSVRHLLLVLLIVLVVFGAKKMRSIGADLGAGLRGLKKGLSEDPDAPDLARLADVDAGRGSAIRASGVHPGDASGV